MFNLQQRTFSLWPSYKCFHQEIKNLEIVSQNKAFPKSSVDLYIKKYLDEKLNKFDVVLKVVLFLLSGKINPTENSV